MHLKSVRSRKIQNIMWYPPWFSILILLYKIISMTSATENCDRMLSKKVRKNIEKELLPLYKEANLEMSSQCPWHLNKDMYNVYEEHKYEEGPSKWVCQFCGKGFYEERFLDLHFRSRHPHHMQHGPDITCLANFCQVFRCEVMLKQHKPRFWDKALCKEAEIQKYKRACDSLLPQCIDHIADKQLFNKLNTSLHSKLCGFLTCDKYWDLPTPRPDALKAAVYVFGWIFTTVSLFVYYFVTCTHFFSDDSLIDPQHRQRVPLREKLKLMFPEGKQALTKSHVQ